MQRLLLPLFIRLRQFGLEHQDVLLVNMFLLLKAMLLQGSLGAGHATLSTVLTTCALLVVFTCPVLLLRPRTKARGAALALFDIGFTVLFFADAMFYHNYSRLLPLPMLSQAGQVGAVWDSVWAMLTFRDGVLFVDFFFILPYLWLYAQKKTDERPSPPMRRRARQTVGFALTGALVCILSLQSVVNANGSAVFQQIYTNSTVLQKMGVLSFHAADVYNATRTKLGYQQQGQDLASLKEWMAIHRQEQPHDLQGIAKGKNVIWIQLESMQNFLIGRTINGQEITPNLNRLTKQTIYFDNYFPQIADGVTSDAEFMSLNSLYPLPAGAVYVLKSNNTYESLPKLLKSNGYTTYAFHGYKPDFYNREKMYVTEGFDKFFSEAYFKEDEKVGWGLSDQDLYAQGVAKLKQTKPPFFGYFLSLSSHHTYKLPEKYQTLNIPKGRYSELFTDYLQAEHYADQALGEMMQRLQKSGLLDNSLLVIYGDHFGNGLDPIEIGRFVGVPGQVDEYRKMELRKVPLLIRLPGSQYAGTRHVTGGQMDLYPTLANLLGLDTNQMAYFGQDLLNAKDGYVAFRNYTRPNSFATDSFFYVASPDGVFEHGTCIDRKTGQTLDVNRAKAGYEQAKWEYQMSDMILQTNGLPKLIKK